jgi:SAM-dependent methyltransferase
VGRRSRFAGGDQRYLRDEQYGDPSRLATRTELHLKYGTATMEWFPWVHEQAAIGPGSRVLDVGCGEARLWSAEVAPAAVDLTLVDASAGMVRAASSRLGSRGGMRAQALVADVVRLPFGAERFDVVVANHMLYHASDPASAVLELARVVERDGMLIAATNGARHLAQLGEIRAEVFGIAPLDDTVAAFGIDSGTPMLRAAFYEVEWLDYEDELRCTDPDDVLAFLRSVPPGEGATPAQVAAMEHAVRRRFREGDGTMVVAKEAGLFRCRGPRQGAGASGTVASVS